MWEPCCQAISTYMYNGFILYKKNATDSSQLKTVLFILPLATKPNTIKFLFIFFSLRKEYQTSNE